MSNQLMRTYELLRTMGPLNPIRTALILGSVMLAICGYHAVAHFVLGMAVMQPRVRENPR